MKVVDLYPPKVTDEVRPMCSATLSWYCVQRNREWQARKQGVPRRLKEQLDKKHPIEKCGCYARYKINGEYFCRKHGALKALDLVMAEEIKK